MKRILAVVAAMLGLLVSAGYASATPPGDPAAQALGQAAASGQAAAALSGASQSQPANQNITVRVLSPGDNGDVSQANTVSSNATAGNANLTGQSAGQTQNGSCGCTGGTQAIGQDADNSQSAQALSYATQSGASNTNVPVRVLSPGDNGSVSQSNGVESNATAANANATGQTADQSSAGGSGTQAVGQSADNEQHAAAASGASQSGAKNTNISVRVLSPGDDGSVDQSNSVDSSATAANLNLTGQSAGQAGGGGGTQAIGQDADNNQSAGAHSAATQHGASNTNIPVRVLSSGDGGDVSQSNSVSSSAKAANANGLGQNASQVQRGGDCLCTPGSGIQAIGQDAESTQSAAALSAATQSGASNTNTPVRVDSDGDDGDVSQSNSVESDAKALNVNLTGQHADQAQAGGGCCGSGGIQAIGQDASNDQTAAAASLAAQSAGRDKCGCPSGGNVNTPVRVDSDGDGGSVDQSNSVDSSATAANLNLTGQGAAQGQGAGGGTQAIGQDASNDQTAAALSAALQHGASNSNAPVRVDSDGDGGNVSQSNNVGSSATAANLNGLSQGAGQLQAGRECGCGSGGIQAIGQDAASSQAAGAFSAAAQAGASNANSPVSVDSDGDGGDVDQSNNVGSSATAANANLTGQGALQVQGGAGGTQAIGQDASNDQTAVALSAALQHGASNSNAPVRVDSDGDGGDVSQSNNVGSSATAANLNALEQGALQAQRGGDCRCGSNGIQAIGQSASNTQGALAGSLAVQEFGRDRCGCGSGGNSNAPVRVDSEGDGGSVDQSNNVWSSGTAANLNGLEQGAGQAQGGSGIQAIGQDASNDQTAAALSAALQHGASNSNAPVRVDSDGDGGDVSQSNNVGSRATGLNVNLTGQSAEQIQAGGCGCSEGIGIQAIGQQAKSEQGAAALSFALQAGASNDNAPVSVDSDGNGGSVEQSNNAGSSATAANLNGLGQSATQAQGGVGGIAIQAIGQSASNTQAALALSAALQFGASNSNSPVAVDSEGDAGDVSQSNNVYSAAKALNLNLTHQGAEQAQSGDCRCGNAIGIQAIGQQAKSWQGAFGASLAAQLNPTNRRELV